MKILVIPDVHGTRYWKQWIDENINNVDKVVFLGDYFDSHEKDPDLKGKSAADNFNDIVNLKRIYNDKVDLLIGNHDLGNYLLYGACTEFQEEFYELYHLLLIKAIDENLINVAVEYDNFIFSHAGIDTKWIALVEDSYKSMYHIDVTYAEACNVLLKAHCFEMFDMNPSPVWIRPTSLLASGIRDKIMVVGHTASATYQTEFLENDGVRIIMTDTVDKNNYLIIDTDEEITFTSVDDYNKRAVQYLKQLKKITKEKNDQKSLYGSKAADMRRKYNITRKQWYELETLNKEEQEEKLGKGEKYDWWEGMENLCKGVKGNENS